MTPRFRLFGRLAGGLVALMLTACSNFSATNSPLASLKSKALTTTLSKAFVHLDAGGVSLAYGAGGLALTSGQSVSSGGLMLVMQTDGNFVLYQSQNGANVALWSTQTQGRSCDTGCLAIFQNDGNLVLYQNGAPYWASGTQGAGDQLQVGAVAPFVQITDGTSAVWAGSTVFNSFTLDAGGMINSGDLSLAMQTDGNFVLYQYLGTPSQHVLWSSGTQVACSTGCFAALQNDGNFVLYSNGHAYWASGTQGQGLQLQFLESAPFMQIVGGGSVVWSTSSIQTLLDGAARVLSSAPVYNGYGVHYPQGVSAVQYLYGPEGTFKTYSSLQNIFAYYAGWGGATANQMPTGISPLQGQLIGYANGQHATSVPDANGHALFNQSAGAITGIGANYSAFLEHNGRGQGGASYRGPFSQFWFDDNWLARFMSVSYGSPQPIGLWQPSDFNRWNIVGLDNTNWVEYQNVQPNNVDLHALNGLYRISIGDINGALNNWNAILNFAGSDYDAGNQRYTYPHIVEAYHMGLFKILTDRLMDAGVSGATQSSLIQHSMSLRSDILSEQQNEKGTPIGWVSGDGQTNRAAVGSLINTESTAASVLGLGAGARYSFEAGRSPLQSQCGNCFLRPHNVLSAVVGLTSPNVFMTYGPYMNLPQGTYMVDFYLRTPNPSGAIAYVDVNDSNSNSILAARNVDGSQMVSGNQWTRISLPITISNPSNSMEFRVQWSGQVNLDVATIRVR